MPNLPSPIQDLISKMLIVDPLNRIKMNEIKNHPGFKLYLPESYILPKPLPIPFISDPIDLNLIPSNFFEILRGIGYSSDEDIINELNSNNHSMSKVFFYLMSHNIAVQTLDWPSGNIDELPQDIYFLTPEINNSIFSLKPDISSPETYSFAIKSKWKFNLNTQFKTEPFIFPNLNYNLISITNFLQKNLNFLGYEWLYPDQSRLIVRSLNLNQYFILFFQEKDENTVFLKFLPISIKNSDYNEIISIFLNLFNIKMNLIEEEDNEEINVELFN